MDPFPTHWVVKQATATKEGVVKFVLFFHNQVYTIARAVLPKVRVPGECPNCKTKDHCEFLGKCWED